jgi:CheY-like chemotaxis protein
MNKKIICVVDDTPELLNNLSEYLEMEGFAVWACINGAEALERSRIKSPDLVITDLWMPAMDGLVFIEKLRHDLHLTDVPVIIFSAKPEHEYADRAFTLGVTHFIKKPSNPEVIVSRINQLIY